MRITSDKLDGPPPHGLSPAEVRAALLQLPAEWVAPVKEVRLSASMQSWDIASFTRSNQRLVLCCRGREKRDVYATLVRQLYSNVHQTHPKPEWRLSAGQKRELDAKIETYLLVIGSSASLFHGYDTEEAARAMIGAKKRPLVRKGGKR